MDEELGDLLEPRWRRAVPVAVVGLLAVAVTIGVAGPLAQQVKEFAPAPKAAAPDHNENQCNHNVAKPDKCPSFAPVGSPQAKVKIDVWINQGNDCQWGNVVAFQTIVAALPTRLRASFHTTGTEAGKAEAAKHGITCQAQLLLNGQTNFKALVGGQTKDVVIHGPLSMSDQKDVAGALHQALAKQYGPAMQAAEYQKLNAAVAQAYRLMAAPAAESKESSPATEGKGESSKKQPETASGHA